MEHPTVTTVTTVPLFALPTAEEALKIMEQKRLEKSQNEVEIVEHTFEMLKEHIIPEVINEDISKLKSSSVIALQYKLTNEQLIYIKNELEPKGYIVSMYYFQHIYDCWESGYRLKIQWAPEEKKSYCSIQ